MIFIEKNEHCERFYSVDCDIEKLREISEKLKNFSYVKMAHGEMDGDITKWTATEKRIKKRVSSFFYSVEKRPNAKLLEDTIVHHTEKDSDYVSFDFTYSKLPDLYNLIKLLFGEDIMFPISKNDQLILEEIFSYAFSDELVKHESVNTDEDYDYIGLMELYREVLGCFKFNLVAVKKYLPEPIPVDIESISVDNQTLRLR